MILLLVLLGQTVDDTTDSFREWQAQMIAEHATPRPELRRVLAHKIHVPEPEPGKPDLTPVRLDFGSMDPLGLLPVAPVVETRIGEPVTRLRTEVEGSLLNLYAVEMKSLHYMSGDDGLRAFGTWEAMVGLDPGWGDPLRGSRKGLIGVASNGTIVGEGKTVVKLSGTCASAEISVTDKGQVEVAGKVGPRIGVKGVAEIAAQVSAEVSAPVVVDHVQWKSRWGLSQVAAGSVERIAAYIAGARECAYCAGQGTVTCRQCADRKTVPCPACARNGRVKCGECNGYGYLTCPAVKVCGRCKGSGVGRCSGCGGSGNATEYDEVVETETRTRKELVHAGFDGNGQPVHEWRTYTEEVPVTRRVSRTVPCGACGGSGGGGTCGNCGGGGEVPCSRCDGTGRAGCTGCAGEGTLPCRTCRGNLDLTCPTCGAKGFSCPLCRGRGRIGG